MSFAFAIEEIEPTQKLRGFGGLGTPVSTEVQDIIRTFVGGLPGAPDTTNASWYNALTYVLGPSWSSMSASARLSTLKSARAANRTYMLRYFAPSQVKELQTRLGRAADGKLGSGTADALGKLVTNWHRMPFDQVKAALPLKSTPGPSAETVMQTTPSTTSSAVTEDQSAPAMPGLTKKGLDMKTILIVAGVAVLGLAFFSMRKRAS